MAGGSFTSSGPCDFCGKTAHVASGYLKVSFVFSTGTIIKQRWGGWCNLRCLACRSCRIYVNLWPWLYVALMVLPLVTCVAPPLIAESLIGSTRDQVRSVLKYSCFVSLTPVLLFVMLFCTQFWRYRRFLGSELHDALSGQFGLYNIYFKSRLPQGEDSVSPAEFIRETSPP
ncbi:MAG: hypothetical protein HY289_07045 [Planctomycetes bacterium]|nr:hypothetical protein [Planctomycetota bacterium]